MKLKVASLFAGIGGIDLGFDKAGAKTIWANEIDEKCSITYSANFKSDLVVEDIQKIKGSDIPKVDLLVAGFPCQPFSVAGYRKGFKDDRGNMFFEIIRLVEEMTEVDNKPKVIFLENVKNLQSHDHNNTFKIIKKTLEEHGYFIHFKVLNTCEYGNIPQNRERIFIVCFLDKKAYDRFEWPKKKRLTNTIERIVKFDEDVPDKYYYSDSLKCYPLIKEGVKEKGKIYQFRRVYTRENKNNLCPTLTANMGTGGHNVPLILDYKHRIRKLTPRECLSLQGFPESYILPSSISDASLYKQCGNAVSVTVIEAVAKCVLDALS